MSDSLRPHEPQHARPLCPSPTPGVHPNPGPSSWWCHPTISSSVVPFSSCPQSFLASGSSIMNQLFASGGQRVGVSASTSVFPKNTQDWSPLGWTDWISLQSKGLSRVLYRDTIKFCTMILYLATLLNLFISSNSFCEVLRIFYIQITLPKNKDDYFFLYNVNAFIYFSCLIPVNKTHSVCWIEVMRAISWSRSWTS